MGTFEEEHKKRLFGRWSKISSELIKVLVEVDQDNARAILEEIGIILLSYPKTDNFLLEYDIFLNSKKNLLDTRTKDAEDNVVNIVEFKNRNSEDKET